MKLYHGSNRYIENELIPHRLFYYEPLVYAISDYYYAWRRAWIGYDDVDMFECFEMFRRRMIRILEDFIKHGHGLLNLPQESEHYNELLKKFPEGVS